MHEMRLQVLVASPVKLGSNLGRKAATKGCNALQY